MSVFTYTAVPTVYHYSATNKTIDEDSIDPATLDMFDWRFHTNLETVRHHRQRVPSPQLTMAVSCLADRWAIWNRTVTVPILSVPFTSNAADKHRVQLTSLPSAWLFLQQFGTVDLENTGYRVRDVYQLAPSIATIQRDIYSHGPVTAQLPIGDTDHFDQYFERLLLSENTCGSDLVYYPAATDSNKQVKSVTVKIIGWSSKLSGVGCHHWIVTTCRGADAFSRRYEYGKNGYFLVASGHGLENHCYAALPFFINMGVKQPQCCDQLIYQDKARHCHQAIHVTVFNDAAAAGIQFTPLQLKTGKRPKHPKPFVLPVEVGSEETTTPVINTDAWIHTTNGVMHHHNTTNSTHSTNHKSSSGKKMLDKLRIITIATATSFRKHPGECVVIMLVVIAAVLLIVACLLPRRNARHSDIQHNKNTV